MIWNLFRSKTGPVLAEDRVWQLGLPEHECIEHRVVTQAIRSAQAKLSEVRTGDRPAESPQEWMKVKFPAH